MMKQSERWISKDILEGYEGIIFLSFLSVWRSSIDDIRDWTEFVGPLIR